MKVQFILARLIGPTAAGLPLHQAWCTGNGDGRFQAAQSFGVASAPYSAAVGNSNGDGAPDLAVANQSSNNVSALIKNTRR